MAAVSGKQYGVGARHLTVFALNDSGSPQALNTTGYGGLVATGIKAFDLTIPEPEKITHMGDDRPLQIDFLPPTEGASGEIRVAQENQELLALLQDVAQVTVGESKLVGLGTSQQGNEPQVGLLMFQQSLNDSGQRNWRYFILPKATIYVQPQGLAPDPSEHRFIVSPAVVSAHLWETDFAELVEGFTEAQMLLGQSEYKPAIYAWLASTATTEFELPSARPAYSTAKMAVFVDGVETTANITKATDSIQFTTAPGDAKRVVCFYEWN